MEWNELFKITIPVVVTWIIDQVNRKWTKKSTKQAEQRVETAIKKIPGGEIVVEELKKLQKVDEEKDMSRIKRWTRPPRAKTSNGEH